MAILVTTCRALRNYWKIRLLSISETYKDKLALLWGEAQKKIAYSYLKMTLCYPNVNYSGLKVTYS